MRATQYAMRLVLVLACFVLLATSGSATTNCAANLASLLDPAKLATLGPRGANPRVQKAVYWLAVARQQGEMAAGTCPPGVSERIQTTRTK